MKSFQVNGPLILVRNPKYVGHPGEVNYGTAKEIDVLPGTSVPVEDFMANKIDVTTIGSTSDLQYVKTHPQIISQMHKAPDYGITYLQYDNSAVPSRWRNLKFVKRLRWPLIGSLLSMTC
nr:hypothetical protein [Alicyclobacillus sacchari]